MAVVGFILLTWFALSLVTGAAWAAFGLLADRARRSALQWQAGQPGWADVELERDLLLTGQPI